MELSVIVVNYNVRYFLRICLESLHAATAGMESEIIVVDNSSSDGSVDMIRNQFPAVDLIVNTENTGFGRACNDALARASGRYVLFINPDTVVGESLLTEAIKNFESDDQTGAVGVCLLDGNGQVLRESKRSIPSLWSSFTKFSGLSDVFKNIPFFNGYYFPTLRYDETGDIDVLPGAFMLIRKKVLDDIGGFDPRFFMYAEDIDLSYRITRAGYRIRYVGSLHVIHFKGESTQKDLSSYTTTFYQSMRLFIQKYTGELYTPFVAGLLQGIVRGIENMQKVQRRMRRPQRKHRKQGLAECLFVLSNGDQLTSVLNKSARQVVQIPEEGHGKAPFYLRYLPSYLHAHRNSALVVDFRSLTFDRIVEIWKQERTSPFYVADSDHSFIISSHNKENQGEVYVFDRTGEH